MRRKKKNWILNLYNENKFYVWIVVGVLVFSGFSIGMAMVNINKDKTIDDYSSSTKITNVSPVKENNNLNNKKDSIKEVTKDNDNKNNDKKENSNNIEDNNENNNQDLKEVKKDLQFIFPIKGEVFRDFSENTLVYSNTLDEWTNHEGIDIKADEAMPVKAIEDGTVIDIKQDPRYGYTIIIDHGQGFKSVYCNLSTLDMVFINKKVEKGQVISGIGNTALFETKDDFHLHFELIKDDQYVNPIKYLKGE